MRRWRWAPLSSGRATSTPVQALQAVERLGGGVLLDRRRLEVEQAAVVPVADRAPHVLLDQAAREVGRRLARVDLAQRLRRRRPTISSASPSASGPVVWASQMRTSTVPKLWCGRTDHHSWVNSTIELVRTQQVDVVLPTPPRRRTRPGRRSAGTTW